MANATPLRRQILTSSSPMDESVSPRRPDKGLLDPISRNKSARWNSRFAIAAGLIA